MIAKSFSLIFAAALVVGCGESSSNKRYEDLTAHEHSLFQDCFNKTRRDITKEDWENAQTVCAKRQGINPSTLPPAP